MKIHSLRYIQSVSSDLSESQRAAFGGNGMYANFDKKFFNKMTKIMRIQSMGASEFEFDSFPDTFLNLKKYLNQKTILIDNFKLKNGKTCYFISHELQKDEVIRNILNFEENNLTKHKDRKKIVIPKGNDNFHHSVNERNPKINGWFDVYYYFFFSFSKKLTYDVYQLLKYEGKIKNG